MVLACNKQGVENSFKTNIETVYLKNNNYLLVYFEKHPIFVIPLKRYFPNISDNPIQLQYPSCPSFLGKIVI